MKQLLSPPTSCEWTPGKLIVSDDFIQLEQKLLIKIVKKAVLESVHFWYT
jgi:hypothetical protein